MVPSDQMPMDVIPCRAERVKVFGRIARLCRQVVGVKFVIASSRKPTLWSRPTKCRDGPLFPAALSVSKSLEESRAFVAKL